MTIQFTKTFKKQYQQSSIQVQRAVDRRLQLFIRSPYNPQLRNHQLTGTLRRYRSINITGDWRAIFTVSHGKGQEIVTFYLLGTHSQLYK